MSLTTRVLIALAAGIALGLALSTTRAPAAIDFIDVVEPLGTLFINAIRMTVIPLVVSLLVVGIADAPQIAAIGRMGWRAVVLFLVLLLGAGILGAAVARPVFAHLHVPAAAVAALRAASPESAKLAQSAGSIQSFGGWVTSLVPPNPVKAAADGDMLPLVIFAVALGLALLALERERRMPVVAFFRGLADAMLVLVRWILVAAPIGVFALALPLVARLGLTAVGVLAVYVLVVSVDAVLCILLLYPVTALLGRVSMVRFARAAAPGQAVALSSRSSLAALPALIEGARTWLGLREEATGFLLPLASATFRIGAGGLTVGTLFLARLYGVDLSFAQVATVIVTATLTSFSIPGVPAAFIVAMVPVLGSVGLPLQGLGILLGVDTIPDSFRTTANVTGQIAVAAMLGGQESVAGDEA